MRDSTDFAKPRCFRVGKSASNHSNILHLTSGLNFDFTLCPIPGMLIPDCFIVLMKSSGEVFCDTDSSQYFHAPSIAQPKRGQIVARPDMSDDLRSFPALAVTIAFVAPETAGP